MDKILFVANISKTASDIFNSLSKNYEIIMQDFNKIVLPSRAAEMQPDLIAVYSNELSHEDVQAYQKRKSRAARRAPNRARHGADTGVYERCDGCGD